jgi:hypothetical protein
MVRRSKLEYLQAIVSRYVKAGRRYKKRILDEFCKVCGYHRKHAIRLLNRKSKEGQRRPGRPPAYGEAEQKVLERIWLAANRPCARRCQPMISGWLPFYEKEYGRVAAAVKRRLLTISVRTLERLMQPVRQRYGTRGKCGTRPGTLLKKQIPIKTHHADVNKPGVMEADTVAHCGGSLDGDFVWSLTLTDIFSGWTENRAVWNRGYEGIKTAINDIEQQLPFVLAGFHSDNGGEFLNHHLIHYLQDRPSPVVFTRGRPNHKDDTAHVEQKNFTHVRLLLGYERIENPDLLPLVNRLYETWGLYNNLFCASLKLIEKKRVGSRYIKKYDRAQTPCQRLINSPDVDEAKKTFLTELTCNVNPFAIKRQIDHLQRQTSSKRR